MQDRLITKYNIPGPRYTSYPTVPYWNQDAFTSKGWAAAASESFTLSNSQEGISLYIHLPFCESMCTFCGCNKRITKNHTVEEVYIRALLKEWQMYLALFDEAPIIQELHLGGGTPTFFSPENLTLLIKTILSYTKKSDTPVNFSFEGHPNNTTRAHLQALYELGFRRVSFGIQDFDLHVQTLINRVQTYESVKQVTEDARAIGYTSVNYDIIYGLPHQKERSIVDTMEKVSELLPDRIAFYSYAHVPWIKGLGQRKFTEQDLPSALEKQNLYLKGKEMLKALGYLEIGMDHFALTHDTLWQSLQQRQIHRNFMGYTESKTRLMVGLGVSAISDSWTAFSQNEKKLEDYYKALKENRLPIFRGHLLDKEDLNVRKHILNLMCLFETQWQEGDFPEALQQQIEGRLEGFLLDGLIEYRNNHLKIKPQGRPFLRNICMAFDCRLLRKKPDTQLFSMTI